MIEQIFFRYNPWWEEYEFPSNIYPRAGLIQKLKSLVGTKDIVILSGLRRIGKTTAMKILIKDLINEYRINPKKIFYISLDDYLLSSQSILEIVDEYRKCQRIKFEEKVYLFLDEIAYKKDFEQQLKNLYDNQNVKVFASSSQSSVIKSKKNLITGRARILEILPLDFNEYCEFKGITLGKKNFHLADKIFEDFLSTGGIPEYVIRGDIEYLRELVDDIILKDIAAQHKIKDTFLLKDFFLVMMERCGKVFSINKISSILNSSPDTIRRYLEYFHNTYLINLLPRFGTTNERLLSAKKIYSADVGIRNIFTGFRDKGSLFENYVYLKIRHRNPSYVFKEGIEIDFFTADKTLIEVKYGRELTDRQLQFFESFKAKSRIVIANYSELHKLEE